LRKISEIYDRIAFAGVGKYNEFDQLRVAGVRAADLKGYQFSRLDVDARGLANQYAQILGQTFTHEMKPLEVEILVAEVGLTPEQDQLFHIMYDGTVIDEHQFTVLGGDMETIRGRMAERFVAGSNLQDAVKFAHQALSTTDLPINSSELEVAVLTRSSTRRCFSRLSEATITQYLV
jgi:proteasome alpha subunit